MSWRSFADRFTNAAWLCLDTAVITLGPVLVILCCSLITFVVSAYFLDVYHGLLSRFGGNAANGVTALGLFLLFNLVFNYLSIVFVGPGHMPALDAEQRALLACDPELHSGNTVRWCRTCDKPKGMRTHHCSVCNRCVLKMDHHCPWVNNCIGYGNLRYFNLFLFYMSTGCLFFLLTSALGTGQHILAHITTPRLLFATVMCFAGMIATFLFLCWNIYLMVTNQSTIEFYSNNFGPDKRHSPYDIGTLRNMREVFGYERSLFLAWLPSRRRPPGDGISFPLRSQVTDGVGWSQRASRGHARHADADTERERELLVAL